MGWFLGCFKCRQRNPRSGSINGTLSNKKDERRFPSTAGPLGDILVQGEDAIKAERPLSVQDADHKRISSDVKTDRKSISARRPSTEQLVQVKKLEEEIDSLNRKLLEEETEATNLTNEVRHLRNCSALLDSPNAFRKALSALEQALDKGHVEESQPLLYLQSLLSKIDLSEAVLESSSEEENGHRCPEGFMECKNVSFSTAKKRQQSLENVKTMLDETDESQVSISDPVISTVSSDGDYMHVSNSEQNTCHSRDQLSSNIVEVHGKKPSLDPVLRRRSSTTLSFSGFLVVEDVAEEQSISDKIAVEQFSCTEFSFTKMIETAESSEENTTEASKSRFAFSTGSSHSHPCLTAHKVVEKDFSFQDSDSELQPWTEKSECNGSSYDPYCMSSKCLWSLQDDEDHDMDVVHYGLRTEECQPNALETNNNGFSDSGEPSLLSGSCSASMDHSSFYSLDSEDSDSQHSTTKAGSSKDLPCTHIFSEQENVSHQEAAYPRAAMEALNAPQSEDIVSDAVMRKQCTGNCPSEGWNVEAAVSEQNRCCNLTRPQLSLRTSTSAWSPSTEAPHGFFPLHPVGFPADTPSTPASSYLDESGKPHSTPWRTPLASLRQAETLSSIQSQSSSSSIGEDRPILGTVAAHWNHSAVSTHKKWWDGKGIPNSTNKYKEDQKVSWHATPFEVRLERALAKQGRVFQKKLFSGAMAAEMEVST